MTDAHSTQPGAGAGAPDVPSPLPFVVSILPLLLSTSNVTLPPATLSTSVLQRHYYLSSTPDTPSTYLQGTADSAVQDAVESRREALASTWLEDVKLSSENEILYSKTMEEDRKLIARIGLSKASGSSADAGDAASLVLLTVYEEAPSPATAGMSSAQAAGSGGGQSSIQPASSADEEAEESGWKYYDLQLPQSSTNLNKAAWQSSISEAEAALSRLLPNSGTEKRNGRSASVSSSKQKESPALKKLRKRQEAESTRGLQGEEGPDFDPEDYWAGCESSDDENGEKNQATHETLEEEDEDDYWNAYGGQNAGNNGSVVDSGHYEAEQGLVKEEQEEDHTMQYSHQDSSDSVGHFEYARGSHENDDAIHDYSFENERGQQDGPPQGGRMLIDDSTLHSRSRAGTGNQNDSFLNALQSSLERVSSSSTQPDAENEPIDSNTIPHMDGVPAHGQRERMSPTFDSAIQKGIAGLWETYLLSSALGGGGKSREIAAYEFMELVQEVIHGQDH